jgi:cyclophilin family peptidyl-prolyl cis-trans isomerase
MARHARIALLLIFVVLTVWQQPTNAGSLADALKEQNAAAEAAAAAPPTEAEKAKAIKEANKPPLKVPTKTVTKQQSLKCSACEIAAADINARMCEVSKAKRLLVGSLDSSGKRKSVRYARSETHVEETLSGMCGRVWEGNYTAAALVRGRWHYVQENLDHHEKYFQTGQERNELRWECSKIIQSEEDLTDYLVRNDAADLDLRTKLCVDIRDNCRDVPAPEVDGDEYDGGMPNFFIDDDRHLYEDSTDPNYAERDAAKAAEAKAAEEGVSTAKKSKRALDEKAARRAKKEAEAAAEAARMRKEDANATSGAAREKAKAAAMAAEKAAAKAAVEAAAEAAATEAAAAASAAAAAAAAVAAATAAEAAAGQAPFILVAGDALPLVACNLTTGERFVVEVHPAWAPRGAGRFLALVGKSVCAAQTMHEHCKNTAQTLHEHCTDTAQTLHEHCTDTAQTLHEHCTNTAQTLHKHCTNRTQAYTKTHTHTDTHTHANAYAQSTDDGHFDDNLVYRAVKGFLAQFGVAATPVSNDHASNKRFVDDDASLVKAKGEWKRGLVSFAGVTTDDRAAEIFVALAPKSNGDGVNAHLGGQSNDTPFGVIIDGLDAFESAVNFEHGNKPAAAAEREQFKLLGNAYLNDKFAGLTNIKSCRRVNVDVDVDVDASDDVASPPEHEEL